METSNYVFPSNYKNSRGELSTSNSIFHD